MTTTNAQRAHEHRWVAWPDEPPEPYHGIFTCAEEGCALTGTMATLARLVALEEVARRLAHFDEDDNQDGAYQCHWCERTYVMAPDDERHADDCPVTVARELMRAQESGA